MKNKIRYLFLIGGYDLEMSEIINILKQSGLNFIDKKLKWGAKLSDYSEYLSHKGIIAGIELTNDITPPKNYLQIDHHNENSGFPSSIEQIAELLGIELTHYQKLIAANDKGYIPAMESIGASDEEIKVIRKKDRSAQGVTQNDEKLAAEAISNMKTIQGIVVLFSKTSKFSAITDRLYPCNKLLIYTNHELAYFGEGAGKLAKKFTSFITKHKAYCGGGENGFFGFVKDFLPAEEIINKALKEIPDLINGL